jgi:hypothetical protein
VIETTTEDRIVMARIAVGRLLARRAAAHGPRGPPDRAPARRRPRRALPRAGLDVLSPLDDVRADGRAIASAPRRRWSATSSPVSSDPCRQEGRMKPPSRAAKRPPSRSPSR